MSEDARSSKPDGEEAEPGEAAPEPEKDAFFGGGEDAAVAYVAPRELPKKARAKTIDGIKIKLAPSIDPHVLNPDDPDSEQRQRLPEGKRRAPTMRKIDVPPELIAAATSALKSAAAKAPEPASEPAPEPAPADEAKPSSDAIDKTTLPSAFGTFSAHADEEPAPRPRSKMVLVVGVGAVAFVGCIVALFTINGPARKQSVAPAPSSTARVAAEAPRAAPPAPPSAEPTPPAAAPDPAPEEAESPSATPPVDTGRAKWGKPKWKPKPKDKEKEKKFNPSSL